MSVQVQTEDDELFLERKKFGLKQRLGQIVVDAKSLVVNNEEAYQEITRLYNESKDWEKQIEFARKIRNAPDQDRINARNDKAKELLMPIKEIQQIAKLKAAQYETMLEEAKRKEEERIKEAVDLLGLEDMPYIPPMEKSHRGNGTISYTKITTKFKLVDINKVPLKYLKIDENAIERDIKMGVAEIPGLEIFQEKTMQLRCR